jgi:hypothetical protein
MDHWLPGLHFIVMSRLLIVQFIKLELHVKYVFPVSPLYMFCVLLAGVAAAPSTVRHAEKPPLLDQSRASPAVLADDDDATPLQ